jgi:hypothetical protein
MLVYSGVARKGIGLIFPNRDVGFVDGNITELGDVCGTPGKSSLFFLTAYYPGIRLPGDRVPWQGKHFKS